ncbi:MAG: DUF4296 domain-containing protein [Bacteroidales bacterium]
MKSTTPFHLILLILLVSCGSQSSRPEKINTPENILSHDKMVDVLVDFHLAESTVKYYTEYGAKPQQIAARIYPEILEKHQISRKEFRNSMDFFTEEPERMQVIYSDVMEQLSSRESEIRTGK